MSRTFASILICSTWFLAATPTRAEPVRLSFSSPSNEVVFPDGATGGISFPNTAVAPLTGDGAIVATKLMSWSIAPESSPDSVTNLPYRFALAVRDEVTGEAARLSFEGTLSGSFWRTGSDLENRFTGSGSQSVVLGGSLVTVAVTDFDAPTGYGEQFAGSISARVTVTDPPGEGDPTLVATPEPGSVVLALLGLTAIATRRGLRCAQTGRLQSPAVRRAPRARHTTR